EGMASLPYPLCHDCTANLVGMARMPYPPTICKDYSELLLIGVKEVREVFTMHVAEPSESHMLILLNSQ
ncbi:hypothetical protein, partial [Prevotella sp.]|uniref:hypothetical protein n=1 Tax=Prevotella sp. TaxID=59823 RepID=UPI0027E34B31